MRERSKRVCPICGAALASRVASHKHRCKRKVEIQPALARDFYASLGKQPIAFTTDQAMGAWPNGMRIRKTVFGEGDAHAVGEEGVIVGSLGPYEGQYCYFVRWDDMPRAPVFVEGRKIGRVTDD